LHGHVATHTLPVLSLSKRAVTSLVIGHLRHSAWRTNRSQCKVLVITVKASCVQ
jgi:hypothetical protein